jgi:hypothetical protein
MNPSFLRLSLFWFLSFSAVAGAASVLALGACSSQADTTYRGVPLATLQGTVLTSGPGAPPPVDVALAWGQWISGKDALNPNAVANLVPVTGQFPSAFSLQLFTPPSDADLIPCGGSSHAHVGTATILAVRTGVAPSALKASDVYGRADDFEVIYADSDLGPDDCPNLDSIGTKYALRQGYNLVQTVTPAVAAILSDEPAYAACLEDAGFPDATALTYPPYPPSCAGLMPASGQFVVPLTTPITLTIQSSPIVTETAFTSAIAPPSDAGNECLPQALAVDASTGEPDCHILMGFPDGTCAPGFTTVDPEVSGEAAAIQENWAYRGELVPVVCELPAIPSTAWVGGSCAQSTTAGWCYVSGAAAGSCSQGIVFSAATAFPSQGVSFSLTCVEK